MKRDIEWVTEARHAWLHPRPRGQRTLLRELFSHPGDFGDWETCDHLPVAVAGSRLGILYFYLPERGTECNKVFVYRPPVPEYEMADAIRTAEDSLTRVR